MKFKLSDLFDLQMGKTPSRSNPTYWNGNYTWVAIKDLDSEQKYIASSAEGITDVAVKESGIKAVPAGTVIMSFKLSIGKAAITSRDLYTNEAIMAFIDKGKYEIDPNYLYYLLTATDWTVGTNKAVKGATLNKKVLSDKEISLPPLATQKDVSAKLDSVMQLICVLKDIQNKLDNLVKSRFVEMFGDPATPGEIFPTEKLGNVADVKSSHRVFTTEFVESGIPFYRGTEIGELAAGNKPQKPFYISEEHYHRIASDDSKPEQGDLLLPSICNKGQVWMVDTDEPFYYKDGRVLCISPHRDVFNSKYLQYYMRMRTVAEYPKLGSGSTFAEFKIFQLKNLDVDLPPKDLQNSFAAFVEDVDKSKLVNALIASDIDNMKKGAG